MTTVGHFALLKITILTRFTIKGFCNASNALREICVDELKSVKLQISVERNVEDCKGSEELSTEYHVSGVNHIS